MLAIHPGRLLPVRLRRCVRHGLSRVLSIGLHSSRGVEQPDHELAATRAISIVVAVHDAPQAVARCLLSLQRCASQSEVIIVDDHSRLPQTTALLQSFVSRNSWTLLRHGRQQGHSASCATGAAAATRPHICLLNSDTVVTPWGWHAIVEAFDRDPTIGIAGPSTSRTATPQQLPRAFYCRSYWSDPQIDAYARRCLARFAPGSMREIDFAGGFALFIRRTLWHALGGFDTQLPDYGNEVELCRRVRQLGSRIVWVQNSYIHHLGQQSYARYGSQELSDRRTAAQRYIERVYGPPDSGTSCRAERRPGRSGQQ